LKLISTVVPDGVQSISSQSLTARISRSGHHNHLKITGVDLLFKTDVC